VHQRVENCRDQLEARGIAVRPLIANILKPPRGRHLADEADNEITELERQVRVRVELERRLAEKKAAKKQQTSVRDIVPAPRSGPTICSHQQEATWLEMVRDPRNVSTRHIAFALRLHGDLDVTALEGALHALVVRHEGLRTRFVEEDGQPLQLIDPPPSTYPLSVRDIAVEAVEAWVTAEVRRPTDLTEGPLFRVSVARVTAREHVLVLVVHHIVADGWSVRILASELSQVYAARINGTAIELPDPPVQPADYAVWQRDWLSGPELNHRLSYWRERLAHLRTMDFPTDRPYTALQTGAGAVFSHRFPDDLADAARTYARANRVSTLSVLHAALLTVLHRYTGQTDLTILSNFSGRTRPQLESLVSNLTNVVALRTNVNDGATFATLVRHCHETILDASAHQEIPFHLIVDVLQPDCTARTSPLFPIGLALNPKEVLPLSPVLGDTAVEMLDVSGDYACDNVNLSMYEGDGGAMDLLVEYPTELFDADRMDRLLGHCLTALAQGLAEPDQERPLW